MTLEEYFNYIEKEKHIIGNSEIHQYVHEASPSNIESRAQLVSYLMFKSLTFFCPN